MKKLQLVLFVIAGTLGLVGCLIMAYNPDKGDKDRKIDKIGAKIATAGFIVGCVAAFVSGLIGAEMSDD